MKIITSRDKLIPQDNQDIETPYSPGLLSRRESSDDFKLEDLKEYLKIRVKEPMELIEIYTDSFPLLQIRKAFMRINSGISELFRIIIKSFIFECITLIVIMMNTIVLAFVDFNSSSFSIYSIELEYFFLYFYTAECAMKIGGFGFICNKNAYLRDKLNIIDFGIVIATWMEVSAGSGLKLNVLRALRIIRPLKSISSIQGLRAIILALASSLQPLISAMILISFFILIFAVAGLQLWQGLFKNRCFDINTGVFSDHLCGGYECPDFTICTESRSNPNFNTLSFDNIYIAIITTFQCITMEGWTSVMLYTQFAYSYYAFFYFIPLEFIGASVILNLTLAIITSSFTNFFSIEKSEEEPSIDIIEKLIEIGELSEETNKKDHRESIYRSYSQSDENVDKRAFIKRISRRKSRKYSRNLSRSIDIMTEGLSLAYFPMDNHENEMINIDEPSPYRFNSVGTKLVFSETDKDDDLNFINNDKHKSINKKSMAYSLRKIDKIHKKNPYSKNQDHSPSAFTSSLRKLKSVIKIEKKSSQRLKVLKNDIKNIGVVVDENYKMFNESYDDVIIDQDVKETWDFDQISSSNYKNLNDFLIDYENIITSIANYYGELQGYFQLFAKLSLKYKRKKSFSMLQISASKVIIELNNSKCIVSEFSSINDISSENKYTEQESLYKFKKLNMNFYEKMQEPLLKIMRHKFTIWFTTLCILFNTFCLAIDHYGISSDFETVLILLNNIFTYIFAVEMVLKLISLGATEYLRDRMNYFDSIVVVLSLIEIFVLFGSNSSLSAFRVLRVFRIFRVLKVVRIFRYLKSIALILKALNASISKFIYLLLLLGILLVVFSLLGMQIFRGNFNFPEGVPRANFDKFHWSIITMFQVLSTENWNDVLTSSLRYSKGTALFHVVWILIGNFVLLNLVLAILIKSFGEHDEDDQTTLIQIQSMKRKIIEFEKEIQSRTNTQFSILMTKKSFMAIEEYCEKSFFIFGQDNFIRKSSLKIVSSKLFDNFILALIVLSSIKLVWDTYILNSSNVIVTKASYYFDISVTIVFTFEFILKSLSIGFAIGKNTYLKENWNKLDLIIVFFSLVDISIVSISMPIIKVLRLLRTLRPLKLIHHNISMRIVVIALLDSIAAIVNVLVVIVIIWLVFAIVGASLFGGKLYCCTQTNYKTRSDCEKSGFEWKNSRFNFDNVLEAMITLFIIISQESWPTRMYEGIDAKNIDECPQENYNPLAAIYYISYLIIGNFFLITLFTAVVFEKFNKAKKNSMSLAYTFLEKPQLLWMELQKLIINAQPNSEMINLPTSPFRKFFYRMCKNKKFELFITVVIILNAVAMCMPYEGADTEYMYKIEVVNQSCTYIFICETVIKLIAYGKYYFHSTWNRLDMVVVCCSIVDLFLSYFTSTDLSLIKQIPQLMRILRVFRIARIIQIIKLFIHLQNLIFLLAHSITAILNVLSLLLLVLFVFSIIGVFLFNSVTSGQAINEYNNFQNFSYAMLILWRISTGEDYPTIMMDCVEYLDNKVYSLYFIVFIIIIDFLVLELFVSVILQNYEDFSTSPDSVFKVFNFYYKKFTKIWIKHTDREGGKRLHESKLVEFVSEIVEELELFKNNENKNMLKMVRTMNLESDESGFFYFNDILFHILKKKFFIKRSSKQSNFVLKYLKKLELSTLLQLKKIRKKMIASLAKENSEYESKKNKFFSLGLMKTVFTNWKKYTTRRKADVSVTPLFTEIEFPGCNTLMGSISFNPSENY